jgi:hypothetical protein
MSDNPTSIASLFNEMSLHPNSNMSRMMRSVGVTRSAEFLRIKELPRRERPRDLSELMTRVYKTPNGQMSLRLLQAFTLTEMFDYGGAFCLMPVGSGKTLVSLLGPSVVDARRPLLLVPANLREKTLSQDIPFYRQHWRLPENLRIISYGKLSSEKSAEILWEYMPDWIFADEIHALKNPKAARTRRFLRYFKEMPNTKLVALSGTMTRKSLRDYWHIIKLCLPNLCPLPLQWKRLEEWADAVDADVREEKRVAPGALMDFCREGENVRRGFRRRLMETPGVVGAMGASAFGDDEEPGIEIHEVEPPPVPDVIEQCFEQLRTTWCTPGGEEISDGMSLWRHASSLALGYYTRWIWPSGDPDRDWLDKRRDWKRFVRETLKHNRRGLDSELQVANACDRGEYDSQEWRAWVEVRDRYGPNGPPTETVWIDHWLVDHAAQMDTQIIWTRSPELGRAVAASAGVPYFGAADEGILTYEGNKLVASLQAHGTGKNLQRWHKNLFVGTPYGAVEWQQTMGRTHRPGQNADVVEYRVYLHCKEMWQGFQRSVVEAHYIEDTTEDKQKLLQATVDLRHSPEEVAALEESGHPRWR